MARLSIIQALLQISKAFNKTIESKEFVKLDLYYSEFILYAVIDEGYDLDGVTMRYYRKGKTSDARYAKSLYHENRLSIHDNHRTGWHQPLSYPVRDNLPLIVPYIGAEPDFVKNGKAYYQIMAEGKTLFERAHDDVNQGNGKQLAIGKVLSKMGGLCLVKNGRIISNFAKFKYNFGCVEKGGKGGFMLFHKKNESR